MNEPNGGYVRITNADIYREVRHLANEVRDLKKDVQKLGETQKEHAGEIEKLKTRYYATLAGFAIAIAALARATGIV